MTAKPGHTPAVDGIKKALDRVLQSEDGEPSCEVVNAMVEILQQALRTAEGGK